MAREISPSRSDDAVPELKLTIEDGRPIRAEELGRLLSALAADYRKVARGHTLVVARVEVGSILIWLQDALTALAPYGQSVLDAAKAAKGLREFAEALSGAIKPGTAGRVQAASKATPTLKSAAALLKIATESDRTVQFESVGINGENFRFTVTPNEAAERQAAVSALPSPTADRPRVMDAISHEGMTSQLAHLAESGPAGATAVQEAVAIIAHSLRGQGMESALLSIAQDLELRGLSDLAQIVRSHVRGGDGRDRVPVRG